MKSKYLYRPFELHVSDMEHWQERPLVYQFFEIVQIIEGEGTRIVNENKFSYHKGSIFLFTPLDCRGFESRTPTRFCSIRFSEVFLEKHKNKQEKEQIVKWLKQLENIFTHHNRFKALLIRDDEDCDMVSMLIKNMTEEYHKKPSYYEENLQHFVTLILNILSRNVLPEPSITSHIKFEEPLINKMLVHIHQHIHCPQKLKIKHLAEQFHLSASYIGEYFKKITGDSLHCYIMQYKMNLIEQRLIHSEHTIEQIADELGFSDTSHLSRQFKKEKGMTPAGFRKRNIVGGISLIKS